MVKKQYNAIQYNARSYDIIILKRDARPRSQIGKMRGFDCVCGQNTITDDNVPRYVKQIVIMKQTRPTHS